MYKNLFKKIVLKLPLGSQIFNVIKFFYYMPQKIFRNIKVFFINWTLKKNKNLDQSNTQIIETINKQNDIQIRSPYQNKLNIGGGEDYQYPNWINLDNKDKNCSFDLANDQIEIESRSIDLIYSSHTFEHLSNQTINKLLKDFWRIIKLEPHGRIVIKIPDFSQLLSKWRDNDLDYFDFNNNDNWNYKEIAPTFNYQNIDDTINARACYMFCGYWNNEYGDFFGSYNFKNEGAFNGPPPLNDHEYISILKNNSPHKISKILKNKIKSDLANITFNHQNAWSADELIEHFDIFGFDILSIDKAHICKKYKDEIPDIFGLYNISSYFEFRLRSLSEIYLSWFKYNWQLIKNNTFNNKFENSGYFFNTISPENVKSLLEKSEKLNACNLENLDYPPGYFTGLYPIPKDVLEQFNSGSQYYQLNDLFISEIINTIKIHKLNIIKNLNSNFKILNIRYWTTKPNASPQNSYAFHGDSYPDEIFKIMLYLTPFNKKYGGLELVDNDEIIFNESDQIGVYCLFKNTQVLHRGLPGTAYERKAIEITLCRSLDDDSFNSLFYGNNAYYPISPKFIEDRVFVE